MLAKLLQFVNPVKDNRRLCRLISNGVKKNQQDIILIIAVILISLFSFAAGYITAKYQNKEPIQFEINKFQAPNSKQYLMIEILITKTV